MPASWQSELGENYVEDLQNIFEDYQSLYKDTRQPKITEMEFDIKVGEVKGEPINFVGKIDELYLLKRNGKKAITIGEHKTFSVKPDTELLVMNTQKCLYAKAVQILKGILPDKVKWDYIKSKPAQDPIWLEKSHRFSTAFSKSITPFSFERACRAKGITGEELEQGKARYEGNIPEFFFQLTLDIDPMMVEDVWDSYMFTAKQIIRFGEKNKARNISKNCSYCEFKPICYAELTGGDVDYTIEKDYTRKGE